MHTISSPYVNPKRRFFLYNLKNLKVRFALISFLVGCSFGQTEFTCWECQDGFGVADNAKCRGRVSMKIFKIPIKSNKSFNFLLTQLDKKPDGNKVNVKKCEYGCAFLTYKMDSNIGGISDSEDAIKRTCYRLG